MQRKLLGGFEAPFRHRFLAARTAHRESWGMSEPQGHQIGRRLAPLFRDGQMKPGESQQILVVQDLE
jgi:hypothetical protein